MPLSVAPPEIVRPADIVIPDCCNIGVVFRALLGVNVAVLTATLLHSVNWTLGVPYQTAFAKNLYSPTNRKVELPPELAAKHVYGEAHVDSIREVPWDELLPQRDALLERWTREIG